MGARRRSGMRDRRGERSNVFLQRGNCKGLTTLCVQSAQSRTRSSEIAFLRSLKIVQLIGNTRTEPH